MADKTIGDLLAASAIYDDDLFLLEQSGEAKNLRGALYKAYLQGFVDAASAASEEASAALAGVRDAINNIPEGAATPIVNDLTTGGTSMALSAEMGKQLKTELEGLTPEDIEALPLDGSKAMTGDLSVEKTAPTIHISNPQYPGFSTRVRSHGVSGRFGTVQDGANVDFIVGGATTSTLADVLTLVFGGNLYNVLHTGNKPSGSYTGNGSSEVRSIATGGIGNIILVTSAEYGAVLVMPNGGIQLNAGEIKSFPKGYFRVEANCTLVTATGNEAVNANGVTYDYRVL